MYIKNRRYDQRFPSGSTNLKDEIVLPLIYQIFQTLAEQYPLYKAEATWRISLVYLKKGELADSLLTLQQIPKDSSCYPEARQLIRQK
ncbi:MAG: hypothetical protein R2828_07415 [Saprospiraceae bacterium]